MAIVRGIVQAPSNISFSDGDDVNIICGKQAELLVAMMHSDYYTQAYRGYVFHASTTPLGLAIPIYTSTAPTVCLWNPIGSGRNLSLIAYSFAYVSGTASYSAIGLSYVTVAGSTVATGSVFSAFGTGTPVNGIVGGGGVASGRVAIAGTTTLTSAPAAVNWFYTLGNINLEAATGTAHGTNSTIIMPRGSIIVPPGTAVWVSATIASSALYAQTISWSEVPT